MAANNSVAQFLTFMLGAESFAVDILKVQEIKSWVNITPLPNMPSDVRGVINLRGAVVPVIDLRRRFHMPDIEPTKYSVIIVVRVAQKTVGLVVDAVSDVLDVHVDQIAPPPQLEAGGDTEFMSGLARTGEQLIVLLDIERTLGEVSSAPMQSAPTQAAA